MMLHWILRVRSVSSCSINPRSQTAADCFTPPMLMFPVCRLTFRRDKHLGLYLNADSQEDDLPLYFGPREGLR